MYMCVFWKKSKTYGEKLFLSNVAFHLPWIKSMFKLWISTGIDIGLRINILIEIGIGFGIGIGIGIRI